MIALLVALAVALAPAAAPGEVTPPQYSDVWAWCVGRFPSHPDLQQACQWGAYEMVPTTDWRA